MLGHEVKMKKNDQNDKSNQQWIDIPAFVNGSEMSPESAKIKKSVYEYDDSNNFVKEVNNSLARQVSEDLDRKQPKANNHRRQKKRKSGVLKAAFFVLLALATLGCVLLFTPAGNKLIATIATEYIYGNLDYEASDDNAQTAQAATDKEPTDKIVNILLIGIEEIQNAQNTDSMIIATMNTQTHSLKLTSLMRDLYVDRPGYDYGRLNSAYAKGGIDLLYDTIETNFGIKIDGYCMVNFNAFQQIVDQVGGVEVTLTEKEAHYLNTKNYISDRKNRNVVAGTQTLNGNQALGYCRVRKVSTSTESNDFGRTQRQRIVLKSIYNKVKKKNILEQAALMNKILKEIKPQTDITKSEFRRYMEEAMSLKVKELESLRVPTDGSYENKTVKLGKVNQEVLVPTDWNATRTQIYNFINGTEAGTETDNDKETATGVSSNKMQQ